MVVVPAGACWFGGALDQDGFQLDPFGLVVVGMAGGFGPEPVQEKVPGLGQGHGGYLGCGLFYSEESG